MNLVMDIVLALFCVVLVVAVAVVKLLRPPREEQPRVNRAVEWEQVRVNITFWAMAKDLEEAR